MNGKGRPLRFAAITLCAWTGLRIAILWPQTGSLPAAIQKALPIAIDGVTVARGQAPTKPAPLVAAWPRPAKLPVIEKPRPQPAAFSLRGSHEENSPAHLQFALVSLLRFDSAREASAQQPMTLGDPVLRRAADDSTAWRGSAWLYLRGSGNAVGQTTFPQLGGSQMGLRVLRPVDGQAGLDITARASTPATGSGSEAGLGVRWHPFDAPVSMIAEQRIGLDGQPGGPSAALVGGSGPTPIGRGFDLESYGEAGAVLRDQPDYFAAGAARISSKVATIGETPVSIGMGAWASAQRDASRVDIGPSISMPLPVPRDHVRLSLDWRQRLAGDALPGSGPALTIGADF